MRFPFIFDEFRVETLAPILLDELLAEGWRHFGTHFFRYSLNMHEESVCKVISLRIRLDQYAHSKKHRKILRKMANFQTIFRPLQVTPAHEELFLAHRERFSSNIPESLYVFINENPAKPLPVWECAVYDGNSLIASSFIDIGQQSISSIYGMFSPKYESYSLGIATMLLEMDHAKSLQKTFYYHGYCYDVPSHYDYKKQFDALEGYNWEGAWLPYAQLEAMA